MSDESRRLFFALWPPESLQRAIERQMHSQVEGCGGRAVPTHNLHVTLAFLGSVQESRLEAAKACAHRMSDCPAFDLKFDLLEVWSRSRVLSLTMPTAPPALMQLVERLRFNLLSEQFEVSQEEYRAHVTLARDVKARMAPEDITSIEWSVREFVLVESQPRPTGSQYTVLARWPLRQGG